MAFHGNAANLNVTTDVSAGNYGSGNAIPVINIDSSGRLNSINTSSVTYGTLNANANVGTIGSYAFMQQSSGNTQYAPGDTLAGSSLRYSDATGRVHNSTPSGNWRCMGYDSGAALTNSGSVGGSASGSGSLQGGNVQGNTNVNVSGNIQGGKGGSYNVNRGVPTDHLAVGGSVNVGGENVGVGGNVAVDHLSVAGNIPTDNLTINGTASVNVTVNSVTVNTTVAYSSTLWLRYS